MTQINVGGTFALLSFPSSRAALGCAAAAVSRSVATLLMPVMLGSWLFWQDQRSGGGGEEEGDEEDELLRRLVLDDVYEDGEEERGKRKQRKKNESLYSSSWGGWSLEALSPAGLYEFMALALPGMLAMCLVWWAFEVLAVFSGLLRDAETVIAAHSVVFQVSVL